MAEQRQKRPPPPSLEEQVAKVWGNPTAVARVAFKGYSGHWVKGPNELEQAALQIGALAEEMEDCEPAEFAAEFMATFMQIAA